MHAILQTIKVKSYGPTKPHLISPRVLLVFMKRQLETFTTASINIIKINKNDLLFFKLYAIVINHAKLAAPLIQYTNTVHGSVTI